MTRAERLASVRRARKELKLATGFDHGGGHYKAVLAELAKLETEFLPAPTPVLPALGPVTVGGPSILDMDFTHMTSGLGWPAFDTALTGDPGPSMVVIAAEDMVVDTKDSSASPGEAIYCTGLHSKIRYWYAHLKDDHPLGKKFLKGQKVGDTLPTTVGGGTHLHLAINLFPVTGRHARYGRDGNGPNYTHGPYTLRTELIRGR